MKFSSMIIKKVLQNKINNIIVVNSAYSFLILLLHKGRFNVKDTLLISSSTLPKYITEHFPYYLKVEKLPKSKLRKVLFFLWYKIKYFLLKVSLKLKSKNINFYGCDHYFFSDLLTVGKYTLIEDGLINYSFDKIKMNPLYKIFIQSPYGISVQCKEIILTGIDKIPNNIKDKVKIFSIEKSKYLKDIDFYFKINIFDNNENNINSWVLITQGFDEFNWCDEKEKIKLYKTILKEENFNFSQDRLYIKPHPRETTDYKSYFPNAIILQHDIPLEIYRIKEVVFDCAITIYSTAIFNINAKRKIFKGTLNIDCLISNKIHFERKEIYEK